MKVQKEKDGDDVKITFIPETEEEKLIMGTLRNHFFFGLPERNTYPEYAGITSEDNYVTSLRFKFKEFKYIPCP